MGDVEKLGLGQHSLWGYSPALDLLGNLPDQLERNKALEARLTDGAQPINILLINPSDIRHVLRTIANRHRYTLPGEHSPPPIHVYIWDHPVEALARHLLLLQIVQDYDLPIRQRANLFLEIYGNTLVQERTTKYIGRLSKELIKLVCNQSGSLANLVDLSLLKFRERDALEFVFKTWGPEVPYDAATLRDHRLRGFLGQRYDSRRGVVDWDYHEGVKSVASIVHYKQYRDWRLSGIAFEFGDQTYTQSNRTLSTYAPRMINQGADKGFKKEVRGYWLDIVNGPFVPFGVDAEKPNQFAKDLFLIHNKDTGCEQHRHHSVEVAMYNIMAYLWEIETRQVYQMTREHDIFSGLGEAPSVSSTTTTSQTTEEPSREEVERVTEISPEEFKRLMAKQQKKENQDILGENKEQETSKQHQKAREEDKSSSKTPVDCKEERSEGMGKSEEELAQIAKAFDGVKLFLLGDEFRGMYHKKRFQSLFDLVHVSVGGSHFLGDDDLANLLAPHAYVMVENAKYMVPLGKEAKRGYVDKVKQWASDRGWSDDFGKKKRNIDDLMMRDVLCYYTNGTTKSPPEH